MTKTTMILRALGMFLLCATVPLFADERPNVAFDPARPAPVEAPAVRSAQRALGTLDWHTDYAAAYRAAKSGGKMLFLYFRDTRDHVFFDNFERDVLAHHELVSAFKGVVRASLLLDVEQPIRIPDLPGRRLLDHPSFQHLDRRSGIAMIDLTDPKSELHGQVVSAHPFTQHRPCTVQATKVILELPKGTVTQRALTFAVLMHPAAPVSTTQGKCHGFLCKQARRSSELMAQYESVGHHEWDIRYQEISATLGRSGSEVAAAGSGGSLLDAAFQCVDLWYGSPAHWGIMSSPAAIFGYDMVRSTSGNWYGTGVFAN